MLTKRDFDASVRVLKAVRTPVCASVVLTWDEDMTRMYPGLVRMGYVESYSPPPPRKLSSPFRWDRVAATEEGLRYLNSLETL